MLNETKSSSQDGNHLINGAKTPKISRKEKNVHDDDSMIGMFEIEKK
jgi:hypothetical protein